MTEDAPETLDLPRTFGEWLEQELQRKGWLAVDLSRASGVYPSTISKWRNGTQLPRVKQAQLIADALEIPLDDVLRAAGHPVGPSTPSALQAEARSLLARIPDDLIPLALPTLEGLADTKRRSRYRNAIALSAKLGAQLDAGPDDGPQPEPTSRTEAGEIPSREPASRN